MDVERQAYETTIRQLRALVEAQTQLRRAAEGMAREARRELERVAEALCPEEVDRLRVRSPQGLAALTPRQIADLVIRNAVRRSPPSVSVQGRAEDRIAELEARLRAALDRAARAEAEVAAMRASSSPTQEGRRQGLIQQAADLLVAAGYTVDRAPHPLPLPDGTLFQPDLVIRREDQRVPVEVEDLSRTPEERVTRWEACYHLTGGDLRFVVPDPETLDRIRSEVFYWLGSRPFSLRITDLAYGRARQGETVWRVRREGRPVQGARNK